jgi:hypothetical protein
VLLIILPFAHANCGTNATTLLLGGIRPYNDLGSDMTFRAYYRDNAGNHVSDGAVSFLMQNATYNMSYNAGGYWESTITSNTIEDVPIIVYANSTNYTCKTESFTTKFRVPFYVTVQLYKKSLNSTDPTPYTNDFQYVVLVDKNDHSTYSMSEISTINSINSVNRWLSSAVGSKPITSDPLPDERIYLWGNYINGQAHIKVYNPSHYSVYVMSNKVRYSNSAFDEFQKPVDDNPSYLGNVLNDLALINSTDINSTAASFNNSIVSISLTPMEANPVHAIWNIIIVIFIVLLYIGAVIASIYIFGSSPNGWKFIIGLILGGGAIVLGIIWGVL